VPLDGESRTYTSDGYFGNTLRTARTQYSLGMEIKL